TRLGRFVSVDPIIDSTDPQQMHGYAYANNAPATRIDASGLRTACGAGFDIPCGADHPGTINKPKPNLPDEDGDLSNMPAYKPGKPVATPEEWINAYYGLDPRGTPRSANTIDNLLQSMVDRAMADWFCYYNKSICDSQ